MKDESLSLSLPVKKMVVAAMLPGSRYTTHWIMDGSGLAQTIMASCYKDPQKVLILEGDCTHQRKVDLFQQGPRSESGWNRTYRDGELGSEIPSSTCDGDEE